MTSYNKQILAYVAENPGQSATQISRGIQLSTTSLTASISSLLYRLVQEGKLFRRSGEGPRGGYTYYDNRPPDKPQPTRFDRLTEADLEEG